MDKYGRLKSDNWFDYHRYMHIHDEVLDRFNGHYTTPVNYEHYIYTEKEIHIGVEIELISGHLVSIDKRASAKIIKGQLMCQTTNYQYLVSDPVTKFQIRYDSPHLAGVNFEDWDYQHHRHETSFAGKKAQESVIVYMPFDKPQNISFNKTYFSKRKGIPFSYKGDPWPQVEDFLNEVVALTSNEK